MPGAAVAAKYRYKHQRIRPPVRGEGGARGAHCLLGIAYVGNDIGPLGWRGQLTASAWLQVPVPHRRM